MSRLHINACGPNATPVKLSKLHQDSMIVDQKCRILMNKSEKTRP
jgi:hypothetical protein